MSKSDWGDVIAGILILAVVYVLVRPGSLAPQVIQLSGQALTGLVTYSIAG